MRWLPDGLAAAVAARERGIAYVLDRLAPDGAVGDPARDGFVFYRAPWSFALTGETSAAAAVCGWVRRQMLEPDETLDGGFRPYRAAYAYIDSTFICGAH